MSATSTLDVGVSGIAAKANAMLGVADNIANINTVGYKRAATVSGCLVAGQSGDGSRTGGVTIADHSSASKQYLIQSTPIWRSTATGSSAARPVYSAANPVCSARACSSSPDAAGTDPRGGMLGSAGQVSGATTMANDAPIQSDERSGRAAPTGNISVNLDAWAAGRLTTGKIISGNGSANSPRNLALVFARASVPSTTWLCNTRKGAASLGGATVEYDANRCLMGKFTSMYVTKPGAPSIGMPGILGVGAIKSSSREASAADLDTKCRKLIGFKRAYATSSRIITTAAEMLQEAIDRATWPSLEQKPRITAIEARTCRGKYVLTRAGNGQFLPPRAQVSALIL